MDVNTEAMKMTVCFTRATLFIITIKDSSRLTQLTEIVFHPCATVLDLGLGRSSS